VGVGLRAVPGTDSERRIFASSSHECHMRASRRGEQNGLSSGVKHLDRTDVYMARPIHQTTLEREHEATLTLA
jgi:hypothetical protein